MNRHDAQQLIYDVLDNVASNEERRQLEELRRTSPEIDRMFQLEKAFHEKTKEGLKRATSSERASNALKANIMAALDAEDRAARAAIPERKAPSRLFTMPRLVTVAAVVVLLFSAGYVMNVLRVHSELFLPIEEIHMQSAAQIGHWEQAQLANAETEVRDKLGYELLSEVDGLTLNSGEVREIMGVQMGHFVYSDNNKVVSVFVAPASTFPIPEQLLSHTVKSGALTMYDHNCRGCRLMYHRTGNVVVITAESARKLDLVEFVPGHNII